MSADFFRRRLAGPWTLCTPDSWDAPGKATLVSEVSPLPPLFGGATLSVRARARAECVLAAMDLVCSGTVADLVSADHGRRRPLRWAQVSGSDVRSESQDQDKGRRLSSLDEVSEPGLRSGSEDEADVVG